MQTGDDDKAKDAEEQTGSAGTSQPPESGAEKDTPRWGTKVDIRGADPESEKPEEETGDRLRDGT